MHPMHQIQTHTDHIQQDLANSQQQQQNMTVLESLEPVHDAGAQSHIEPILSSLDPVISQQQQQAMINKEAPPPPPVIHHLVQAQPAATSQQPHLHLLRAPCRQEELQQQVNENHEQQQEHLSQQQEQQIANSGGSRRNSAMAARQQQQQQRPQQQHQQPLDGIVADGGGPIVQWLLENYEIADGESLPRSTVYNHYLAHCRQMHMNSVNAASFGKLIRSVFLGLKTRRLGTRGHSKYHYFGVRAKQHVRLDWIEESAGCSGSQNQHQNQQQMQHDTSNQNSDEVGSESGDSMTGDGRLSSMGGSHSSASKRMRRHENNNSNTDLEMAHNAGAYSTHGLVDETIHQLRHQHHQQQQSYEEVEQHQQQQQHYSNGHYYNGGHYNGTNMLADGQEKHVWSALDQSYDLTSLKNHLGLNGESLVEEHWPACDMSSLERQLADRLAHPQVDLGGLELSSLLQLFENNYKSYYKRMLELLSNLQFKEIEHLWLEFWHPTPTPVAHETVGAPNNQWSSGGGVGGVGGATSDTSSQHNVNGSDVADQYHFHHQHQARHQLLMQHQLSYNQLYQLTGHPTMIERINQIDYKLYSAIESFLMPDLLSPLVPRPLVHQIRSLARDFGLWLEAAIKDYDVVFVGEKIKSARAFEYALRRYTSINHLATASRAIWTKRSVLAQMSADLNRIDLRDIEHQVSLMAQVKTFQQDDDDDGICSSAARTNQQQGSGQADSSRNSNQAEQNNNNRNDNIENDVSYLSHQQCVGVDQQSLMPIVQQQPDIYNAIHMQPAQLIASFVHLLDDPYPANMWPDWCRSLVESRVRGQSMEEAQSFILKWNFYISLILRELTLKSAPSLGSFQLLRLLFDEYLYYLVLARLAEAQNKTSTQLLRPSLKTFHHHQQTTTTTTTTTASSLV